LDGVGQDVAGDRPPGRAAVLLRGLDVEMVLGREDLTRISLATLGANVTPTATMAFVRPGPSAATRPMASTMAGKPRIESTIRMRTLSTMPPR